MGLANATTRVLHGAGRETGHGRIRVAIGVTTVAAEGFTMDEPQLDGMTRGDHKEVWIGNVLYTEDRSGLHKVDPHPEELDRDGDTAVASASRSGWRGLFGRIRR
jgi:hypothetical protein